MAKPSRASFMPTERHVPSTYWTRFALVCDHRYMDTNTRAKLITAGLIAAVAMVLPACASQTVEGNAVASTTPPTVTQPTVTVPSINPATEEKSSSIPEVYVPMAASIGNASKAAKEFFRQNGIAMDDVKVNPAMDYGDQSDCTPRDTSGSPRAWACTDVRKIVVHLPDFYSYVYSPAGSVGVASATAHEYGHIVLPTLDRRTDTNDDLEERRADCVSGAFMTWYSRNGGPSLDDSRAVLKSKLYPDGGGISANRRSIEYGMANGLRSCTTYNGA